MIDRRPMAAVLALLGLLLFGIPSAAAENAGRGSGLDRLQQAVAQHPEDPDLVWAYARKLAAEGETEEALAQTRHFVAEWPDRRPQARVEIARSLIDQGATSAALDLLQEEITQQPSSANARFYRGIALRGEGQLVAADRDFRLAAQLEPTLRAETLLARALGLFDLDREDEAVGLLREILELDPTGDTALRARLLLRQREIMDFEGRWRVDGYAGFEYDTNVTLESNADEVLPSDRADFRGVWGAGGTWRQPIAEKASITIGYRYDQTRHVDLNEYDVLSNTLFASGIYVFSRDVALRLDVIAYDTLQDLEQEVFGGLLRPNLIVSFGPKWGATRAFAEVEVSEYDDDALFSPWERDAYAYGLGLEHFLPLASEDSWLSVSTSWQRTITQADPAGGSEGFDGDYDYDSWRSVGRLRLALPCEFRAQIDASYTYDRYHNDNLTHAISTLGGTRQREDDTLSGRVAISRRLVDRVRVEAYWQGTRRVSNVDLYDYDKQVVGLLLRIETR